MAEHTEGSIEILSTPSEIIDVITDFDAYPEWAQGIKRTEIRKKDSLGRPTEVWMEAASMGFGAKYTLTYSYRSKSGGLSWTSKDAEGVVKSIEGEYELESITDGQTKVTYRTSMELSMPVPGFMMKQGQRIIIDTALKGLKKRVERR
jgi:ribosome-associated toxin RatA of RatAB toxin-antitoxin module